MNIVEEIRSEDMDEVIDRMNAYAIYLLKTVAVKNFNGKEPIDFVGDVILKVMEGTRDWDKAKCSFRDFLFGCLKSEISNFFKINKIIYEDELPDISSDEEPLPVDDERKYVSDLLKQEGADDDELTVFEYWVDGITKAAEIAEDLGINVREVYKITKRLERRLYKIQKKVKNII
jgi:DNA-directed RNA polymerase specialized sigma24 family protein